MMTKKLKQRFCKDMGLPIQIFDEPYFLERLRLFGFEAENNYQEFCDLLYDFNNDEQKYFEYYNALKDNIINFIKESECYKALQEEDMSKYAVHASVPQKDIYKDENVGHKFISIDIAKANFSSLIYYSTITNKKFADCDYSWQKFMANFTEYPYFAKSKYIRQVVFGNCNCKRLITFEKYVMNTILNDILDNVLEDYGPNMRDQISDSLICFCNDELILQVDNWTDKDLIDLYYLCMIYMRMNHIPLHFNYFRLDKIEGTNVYDIRPQFISDYKTDSHILKCGNPVEILLVKRLLNGEEIRENDLVFLSNYGKAKLLEIPDIKIP